MNCTIAQALTLVMISDIETIRKIIWIRFYNYKNNLFRILYDLTVLIERLEKDLEYKLPNLSINTVDDILVSSIIKINKEYIDLKLFKSFNKESSITIRFYKGCFSIDAKNDYKKRSSYIELLNAINSFYNIRKRSIAYSLDVLYPGLYIWFFSIYIRIGGDVCPSNYNYIIPTKVGFGVVLPNLMHWHTPFKMFKSIK